MVQARYLTDVSFDAVKRLDKHGVQGASAKVRGHKPCYYLVSGHISLMIKVYCIHTLGLNTCP